MSYLKTMNNFAAWIKALIKFIDTMDAVNFRIYKKKYSIYEQYGFKTLANR